MSGLRVYSHRTEKQMLQPHKADAVGSENHVKKGTVFLDRADVRVYMCKMSLNPSLYLHL